MKLLQFTNQTNSMRYNYALLSTLVALVIVAGTIIASIFVSSASRQNANSLQLRDEVSTEMSSFRAHILNTNQLLESSLVRPSDEINNKILNKLELAQANLLNVKNSPVVKLAQIEINVNNTENHIRELKQTINEFAVLRKDINWVYPTLFLIRDQMRIDHINFLSAADVSLLEITNEPLNQKSFVTYQKITQLRKLWQSKILQFRAVLIVFAGLNKNRIDAEEQSIAVLHEQIEESLDALKEMANEGDIGFNTEFLINDMHDYSRDWNRNYLKFIKSRDKTIWRADIVYMDDVIRPMFDRIITEISSTEKAIIKWSALNTKAIESAANTVNLELLALSVMSISALLVLFYMLHNSVLKPIALITNAMNRKGRKIEKLNLHRSGSLEILTLVNAFNSMRQQIHTRQIALEHQALHDALTGLANRALLQDRLIHTINLASRNNTSVAFLMIDLDRFKEINDTLGHHVGDDVLCEFSNRLQSCMRKSDTVARLGGDEFAIIIPDTSAYAINDLIKKIAAVIDEVIEVGHQQLYISASIGIALYPEHGNSPEDLIRCADIAMYHSKGSNTSYAFFEQNMDKLTVDNLSLLGDLRKELKTQDNQLQLYYQPKLDLIDDSIDGVEALLRWKHPKQGFIQPEMIVRIAEQSGLIGLLTNWVLQEAISASARWRKQDLNLNVAVNLSAMNLQDPLLPTQVGALLIKNEVDPKNISLEVTESAVMSDPIRAREVLTELNNMGMKIAIDDYGTGFSSLAYLKLLPVSSLKIDKSFVLEMLDDVNDSIIVRSTIELAHNLGILVIAEGVENKDVLDNLKINRCDSAQGYYISRPKPEAELLNWLRDRNIEESDNITQLNLRK